MARSNELQTHLSLSRFAKIFGLNPIHFAGGAGSVVWPLGSGCDAVWQQHAWQNNDIISREDATQAIYDAERDIQAVLGYPVAPEFITQEAHAWPKFYDKAVVSASTAVRGESKLVATRQARVIGVGRRAVAEVDTGAAVVYSDPNSDTWDELATITIAGSGLTSTDGVKVYVAGHSADPLWEIRPLKSKSLSGGTLTITLDSWLLIDPDLWEYHPTGSAPQTIDVDDAANFLSTVDVYREYVDSTNYPAQFTWNSSQNPGWCNSCGGVGCASCTPTTQNGCAKLYDADRGFVQPLPATYASSTWTIQPWSVGKDPDSVKLWYYAGRRSQRFLDGLDSDPLDQYLAQAIAWLAVARLEAPPCGCGRVSEQFAAIRKDIAEVDRARGVFFSVLNPDMISNPFGTRRGEVDAWNRVAKLVDGEMKAGVL